MNNLKLTREDWNTHVPYSGWYAWKYLDQIQNDALGVEWFDVQETGTERFVIYYHLGYCYKHKASQPLVGLMVCPVDVTKSGEDTEVKSALKGLLSDWLDYHGVDSCECRPEPENEGHCCSVCRAKIALNLPGAVDPGDQHLCH